MRSSYPTGMLTKLAQAFHQPDQTANNMKTQAYVMSAAANRDRDLAAAEEYKAKTAEREARNQARTPEAFLSAALSGMAIPPNSAAGQDLGTAYTTGRNPVTPGQPAVELPTINDSQIGNFDLASVMANPQMTLETIAPAVAPQERPVDQEQLGELARRMSDFMGMNAATGDTNYQQLQAGAGQRMENAILQKAVSGQPLTPQDMAILKASAVYNSQGINSYTGEGGEAFGVDQGNQMKREHIRSGDRRYGDNTRAASSRYSTDVGAATSRANAALKGDKDAPDESEAINSVDLTVPYFRQVPKEDADYQQFLRIYNNAKQKGDQRTLRALIHKALKNGIIQQGE